MLFGKPGHRRPSTSEPDDERLEQQRQSSGRTALTAAFSLCIRQTVVLLEGIVNVGKMTRGFIEKEETWTGWLCWFNGMGQHHNSQCSVWYLARHGSPQRCSIYLHVPIYDVEMEADPCSQKRESFCGSRGSAPNRRCASHGGTGPENHGSACRQPPRRSPEYPWAPSSC